MVLGPFENLINLGPDPLIISTEDGGIWAAAWPRATAAVTAIVMAVAAAAGVAAAAVVVAEEMMANAKQTVEA